MRRGVLALIGTVAGIALLVEAKLDTSSSRAPDRVATGSPGATPARGLRNGSFTGVATIDGTDYETITVVITVSGGRITAVTASCGHVPGESSDICTAAVRTLRPAVLSRQSANVETVSGATYTSNAYRVSLQSALDKARS
jgi:uncharacterized protein with FMN-binding domain